jgi:uncharacterized RDD family membrane protein YckC
MQRAGFFSRFVALLVDSFAISIVGGVLAWLASLLTGNTGSFLGMMAGAVGAFVGFILVFLNFFYFSFLWSRNGQSIGMRLLNIKVLKRDGALMGFWSAGFRGTLGYWISGLVFGLGFLWAAFDGNKEAWHDKIFGTGVFRA